MRNFSEFHVRQVRCILRNCASLDLELFTKPSDPDFLQVRQIGDLHICCLRRRQSQGGFENTLFIGEEQVAFQLDDKLAPALKQGPFKYHSISFQKISRFLFAAIIFQVIVWLYMLRKF